jgi:hypothetical protein
MNRRALGIGIAVLLSGCAEVHVRKIGVNGEPTGPDGLRFYMPRPYVLVHEPFIVAAKAFVVSGEVSPDGQRVMLKKVPTELDPDLKNLLETLAPDGQLTASQIIALPDDAPRAQGGGAQGRVEGGAKSGGDRPEGDRNGDTAGDGDDGGKDGDGDDGDSKDGDKNGDGKAGSKPTGKATIKVGNDNAAFAVTPLKRYVDIVWLPDFEEQYVVQASSRSGTADVSLQYGQGWSLQGLDATADSSVLLGPLVELYGQATKIVGQVASAKMGLPMGGAQGRVEGGAEKQGFAGGTPVAVKVTLASIAAPGLYPVLKPSEWDKARELARDAAVGQRILVPVPPLTNVAFNIAHAVVIEAARADGDAAMRLYQYIETGPSKPVGTSQPDQPKGAAALQQEIAKRVRDKNLGNWSISVDETDAQAKKYKVTATRPGSDTQNDAAVKSIIVEVIEGAGGTIDGEVVIKPHG